MADTISSQNLNLHRCEVKKAADGNNVQTNTYGAALTQSWKLDSSLAK